MSRASDGAVTRWVRALQDGREPQAVRQLWDTYFEGLVRVALAHLRTHRAPCRGKEDGEDVAISAFHSFCKGVSAGRFPRLEDREDLWLILVVITRRKAADLIAREATRKRGGEWSQVDASLDRLPAAEPGPLEGMIAADLYRTLFAKLGDDRVRLVGQLHMEGWSVAEVAEFLGCSTATVTRRLRYVREMAERLWGPIWTDDNEVVSGA